ncbi:hypothetical protein ABT084_28710 [Streptomyces sp. NPDC002138]|uniref:hypothetical protein n=1 Tax=Streptomyces sp. NPDC002138 TaxID=3154410 RepID=UPI00332E783F
MGSLRNPVGPLPSSIYWRRRAVLASVAALLALLAVWTVSSGGGKTSQNGKGGGGPHPAASITPGAPGSGPAISQAPGGRDESGAGGATGGDHGGTAAGAGAGGAGAGAGTGKNGEPGGAGSAGAGGASSSGPGQVPADSPLPTCAPSALQWEVRSTKNEYEPSERPRLELLARNVSGTTCKVDLGPKQAVLSITQATTGKSVWSSSDCPTGAGNLFYRLPANGETTQVLEWDRKFSAPSQCQTPPAGSAVADTYVVEVKSPGMPVARTSFVLKQD